MAILGQDFNFVVLSFGNFPTLFFFVPPYCQTGLIYSMTKRTASAAFPAMPPTDAVPTALSVFVALSPTQFHQLETDQPIIPDPFSERFGLRTDRLKALERAHYFTNWTPPQQAPDSSLPIHQKQFVLCKLLTTPLGYMTFVKKEFWSKEMDVITLAKAITNGTDHCTGNVGPQKAQKKHFCGSLKTNMK